MKHILTGLTLWLVWPTVEASLKPYLSDGANLVYSSVSDVTWTADANLLGTLENKEGYTKVVNAIIAADPVIHDSANVKDTPSNSGRHTVTSSDFSSQYLGEVDWFGAQAFAAYLNSIDYGGSKQWRLPEVGANPQMDYQQTGGELGQLYYSELNKLAYSPNPPYDFGILGNGTRGTSGAAGPFVNAQTWVYWYGDEYRSTNNYCTAAECAWAFATQDGSQNVESKAPYLNYAWVDSPGFWALPLPSGFWLMLTGLLGLLGLKRRGA